MKLQYRIIIPVALIICLIMGAVLGVSYTYTTKLLQGNVDLLTKSKVDEMKTTIDDRSKDVEIVKADLNAQSIIKARAVASVVANNPKILTDSEALAKLAKSLDVDEIHICDGKGVLRWGTVKDFFGFDFGTTDQTKPFLAALSDKNFELAQDPSPRGTDKVLFQYIGVARQDMPGIVQVGVSPKKLQEAMDKADIGTISSKIVFGASGYGFILDNKTGNILSYKDKNLIGKPSAEIGIDTAKLSAEAGNISLPNGKETLAMSYAKYKDYIICAAINESEFTGSLKVVLNMLILIALISIVLASIIIYIIVKYFVIKEIQKIILVLKEIGRGNLRNELKVNSSMEFKELSKGINDMESDLKVLISENTNILGKLEDASGKLASAASHSSESASELADTVTQMAEGAQDQSESASKGASLAKNALSKLQGIKENIEETVGSTTETQHSIKDGIKIVDLQIEAMKKNSISSNAVNKAVTVLSDKANEIDNIVNVITSIATETNMLALNAAIEAARAGEAGKGFAVVADEVRKLAENSTGSAKKIADIIADIRNDIVNVQEQVGESILAVEEQEKTVSKVQETYGNIAEQTNQAVEKINAIYTSTKSIFSDIENIVKVVEGTAAVSEESAASTEEMSASIQELSAIMHQVDTISGDLKGFILELDKTNSRFTI